MNKDELLNELNRILQEADECCDQCGHGDAYNFMEWEIEKLVKKLNTESVIKD